MLLIPKQFLINSLNFSIILLRWGLRFRSPLARRGRRALAAAADILLRWGLRFRSPLAMRGRRALAAAADIFAVSLNYSGTAEKPGRSRGFEPYAGRGERPGRIERTPAQRSDPARSEAGRGREAGRGGSEKGGGSGQFDPLTVIRLNSPIT